MDLPNEWTFQLSGLFSRCWVVALRLRILSQILPALHEDFQKLAAHGRPRVQTRSGSDVVTERTQLLSAQKTFWGAKKIPGT